ncbi:hypothetical protein ES288_A10G229700v1 [Gossypium darwinii]|uniref:NB-ARC domain-containing protein n=1 Tax=Gossypium darwinii TaxID=34276 RepID=A0A5D2F5B4_GOSDA|nr:hypothetical protein ES288_A10G229700v1 [Gossypium darwinii]
MVLEEIQNLEKELKQIRRVLDDAEERQMKEQLVKDWLIDLQNLAFDVEDVLDEFAIEIGRRNLMMERRGSSSKSSRLNIPHSFNDVLFNRDIMSKIRDLTAKLKDLEPQRNKLELRMTDCERPTRLEQRLQLASLEIENHVYGRDKDKQTILDLLLKSNEERNFVIPIVGMGGIGKTTLAQLVYNDASIPNHFHLKAWACVSDYFDVLRITKEILQSITSVSCNDNDLNIVQEKLQKELSGKKFLIVLDDVWNENYHEWTILQSPFKTRTQGSKIIVTTRNHGVSSTMGALHAHSLELLSTDDSRDFEGHPSLKEVAEKIVRKCDGLPLAAKTLGGLLRTNVSYHHLPLHLKRCFMYCAIIPKDYEFEKEEIILLWRAQGFLQEARDKQCIHDLGHKYFNDLVSRSLLQVCVNNNSRFFMHDLINDLAQSDSQRISKHARHLSYIAENFDGIKKFEGIYEAQHLRTFLPLRLSSVFRTRNFLTNHVLTNLLPNLRCLRALSLEGYQITILPEFVGDLKLLRYLKFSHNEGCDNLEKLPSEMEKLVNLCYLDITGADKLESMASNVSKLTNLQKLSIFWSKDFVNRREEVEKKVLDGLQPSKKLMELSIKFYCGEMLANWVGDSSFNCLQSLCLDGCINLLSLPSIGKLPLLKKVRIKVLRSVRTVGVEFFGENMTNTFSSLEILEFEDMLNWEKWNLCEVDEEARKFPKLRELLIQKCPLLLGSMPEDLPSLKKLTIGLCWKLIIAVQNFPLLSELEIRGCHEVIYKVRLRSIKVELFEIVDCEELCSSRENNWGLLTQSMSPQYLRISNCPQLVSIGTEEEREELMQLKIPSSIVRMRINNCERLEKLSTTLYSLTLLMELKLLGCPKLISVITPLESIEIYGCDMLKGLPQGLNKLKHCKRIWINNCSNLISLGESGLPTTNLEVLRLYSCRRLQGLPGNMHSLNALKKLEIRDCPNVTSILEEGIPTHLTSLRIGGPNIWKAILERDLHTLTCLKSLDILSNGCPDAVSFPQEEIGVTLPSSLTYLCISDFPKLESLSSNGFHNLTSLQRLTIANCPNLKTLPGNNMLSSLLELNIVGCPMMEERCKRDKGPEWSKITYPHTLCCY